MKEIIYKAVYLAIKNRKEVKDSQQCGCYHCLNVFVSKNVCDWTDNNRTALCPKCGVDAVLPNVSDIKLLEETQKYWLQERSTT